MAVPLRDMTEPGGVESLNLETGRLSAINREKAL
jgi:hypothetical protein